MAVIPAVAGALLLAMDKAGLSHYVRVPLGMLIVYVVLTTGLVGWWRTEWRHG